VENSLWKRIWTRRKADYDDEYGPDKYVNTRFGWKYLVDWRYGKVILIWVVKKYVF
jgi:hypothetical protein